MAFLQKKVFVSEKDIAKLLDVFTQLPPDNVWSQVKKADFSVRRFTMGLANDIACCTLTPEARARFCARPTFIPEIVVKFASAKHYLKVSRLEFALINQLMSQLSISPRLLYVDEHCLISEYIEARHYKYADDLDPGTVRQCARLLARVHSATPPISGSGFLLYNELFEEESPRRSDPGYRMVLEKVYLKMLAEEADEVRDKYFPLTQLDYQATMNFTRDLAFKVNSPLVFSHVDFNRGNRLVRERRLPDGSLKRELFLIDFDYSSFNHRGLDLGRYFANYQHQDDLFGNEPYPSDQEMALFLEEYRGECATIQGKSFLKMEENSLTQLIREAKVFSLFAYANDTFFCLMMYCLKSNGPKKKYFLESAYSRYVAYETLKRHLEEEGIIPMHF